MSYQYPQSQYPTYPQPQFPPISGAPGAGAIPPPQGDAPAQSTYTPLPPMEIAELQSAQLTANAAGKKPAELGVKAPDAPSDFPFLMYNQKDGTTKGAKDEKEKADLQGKGYGDNPPKPDPNAITPEMLQALQQVWVKAGEELKRLTQLVDQQQKQMDAASNVLGAGQQQPPQQWTGQQQQYPTGYPQTPTGD